MTESIEYFPWDLRGTDHGATVGVLGRIVHRIYKPTQDPKANLDKLRLERVDKYLHKLFEGSAFFSTFLPSGDMITGSFDEDWMPDDGIEPFEHGTLFYAGHTVYGYGKLHVYSREEMYAWMRYALSRVILLQPHLKKKVFDLEKKYYNPHLLNGVMEQKLAGIIPWDIENNEIEISEDCYE